MHHLVSGDNGLTCTNMDTLQTSICQVSFQQKFRYVLLIFISMLIA